MEFLTTSYCEQGERDFALLLQHYAYEDVEMVFACIVEEDGILDGASVENWKVADASVKENMICCYFAERLLAGFRKHLAFSVLKKPEKYIERAADVFEEVIAKTDREVAVVRENQSAQEKTVSVSGGLYIGAECLMFGRGDTASLLLNRGMGKPCAKTLMSGERQLRMIRGLMEPGVGVLLATGDFLRGIGERELKEGLFVEDLLRPIYLHGQEREAKLTRNSGKRNHRRGSVRQSEMEDRYRQEYMAEKHLRELGLAGTVRKNSAAILILTKEAEVK